MALTNLTLCDPRPQPDLFGLLLIDDRAFADRVRQCLAGIDIRIEECTAEIESIRFDQFAGRAAFVVLDRLMTRSQHYAAARTLRLRFRAPVVVVDADWPSSFDEAPTSVLFLDRADALAEIRRIVRFV